MIFVYLDDKSVQNDDKSTLSVRLSCAGCFHTVAFHCSG